MDDRLLRYYDRELKHLRDVGGEFAKEFPKVAGRLGLDALECADPYVERLLEGFAFMAARVQLKLDAEFPRFTQQLLDNVNPLALCPIPSMLTALPTSAEKPTSVGGEWNWTEKMVCVPQRIERNAKSGYLLDPTPAALPAS